MTIFDKMSKSAPEAAAQIVQAAFDSAIESAYPAITDFLDEVTCIAAKDAISEDSRVVCRIFGGYRGSRRCRVVVAPAGFEWEGFDPGIAFFCVHDADAGPDEMATYIKASGVQEGEVGDLFLSGGDLCGAATIVAAQRISAKGLDVRGVPKVVSIVDSAEISLPGQQARQVKSTVNSMRLDAVSACGFPASRTRLATEIEIGRVKLNGKTVTDPSAKVRQGDSIVIRGRGRLTVDEEGPITKKGRISLKVSRYSPS